MEIASSVLEEVAMVWDSEMSMVVLMSNIINDGIPVATCVAETGKSNHQSLLFWPLAGSLWTVTIFWDRFKCMLEI